MEPNIQPQQNPTVAIKKKEGFFMDTMRIFLYMCISLFLISSLSIFKMQSLATLWFIPAGATIIGAVCFFILGLFDIFKGRGWGLLGKTVLLFLILIVVGAGTCMLNINGGALSGI